MQICPNCGQENPEGFSFCGRCGLPLTEAPAREERKVVTVLFADLVGFTARSEQMDPEDVRATLTPYYARLRETLEHYGGTVEKFIGDAVMALFGAPTAHEDDPERAVRAALAIRDAIAEEDEQLELRIGVNTGEALVALGARPGDGEGMASGDVVNTAARLQSSAPVNGILVGEATYRATRHTIEYREAEPVAAKGKTEPVPVWEAVAARSRFGVDVADQARTPLVGRERELGFLVDALARARSELAPQLVTLVGVPGIGKSRLVAELLRHVEDDPDLIAWRQGRSLPYGESLSYWALGEVVKAQAGILESDPTDVAEAKLHDAVVDHMADAAEADWVEGHLRPLVGLSGESETTGDRRSEAHAAWRRFLESVAEVNPLVVIFEDLHWADEGLLDFVDYLAEWAGGVPILIVGTARPELLDRRPGWGGGKRNAATVSISALSAEETAKLLAQLLEQALLPAEIQSRVLALAEGNPLYAEEYVRMLQDRGFLVHTEAGWRLEETGELPLPETVQGMIAARLDALPPQEKELLQDAAVLGKVFWRGALAAIGGGSRFALEEPLHALERKEFIRRERRSSVAGETQLAFLHLLVRDVAYGQIPRAQRVDKHRAAAEWIATLAADRSEDRAQMLAHHYVEALELARASGLDDSTLREPALAALTEASERAEALNAWPAALNLSRQALELTAEDDPERPNLYVRLGVARWFAGAPAPDEFEQARQLFVGSGRLEDAARAEAWIAQSFWFLGDRERLEEIRARASELIGHLPPSAAKARVLATYARIDSLGGRAGAALNGARQALEMAEAAGADDILANTLNTIGMARIYLGDREGMDDMRRSLELALAANSSDDAYMALNNLANFHQRLGELDAAAERLEEARPVAERFGNIQGLQWLAGEAVFDAQMRGRWDDVLHRAGAVLEQYGDAPHYLKAAILMARGEAWLMRGELGAAFEDTAEALAQAQEIRDPQILEPATLTHLRVLLALGRRAEADQLLPRLLPGADLGAPSLRALARAAGQLGRAEEYLAAAEGFAARSPWLDAGFASASGDPLAAAEIYARIGALGDEAESRLAAAEQLAAEGRSAEAQAQSEQALAYFRRVGAKPYVLRGEALLAASA